MSIPVSYEHILKSQSLEVAEASYQIIMDAHSAIATSRQLRAQARSLVGRSAQIALRIRRAEQLWQSARGGDAQSIWFVPREAVQLDR